MLLKNIAFFIFRMNIDIFISKTVFFLTKKYC